MSKVIKNTIYYSIGEVVPRVISFLLLPILTTYLTTKEYGINSYTTTVMTFVFVIGSLSLNTFVLKNYYVIKDENERKQLIGSMFLFICYFNLILVLLQILVFPYIINYFEIKVPFNPYFILSIVNNFFDVISIIPLVLFRVKEDAKGFLFLSLSRIILQFIGTYIFVVMLGKGLEGSYYARLIVNIPFLFLFFYVIKKDAIMKMQFSLLKEAMKFSLPLLPGSIAYLFVSLSDRIILERYVGLQELGVYSVAATLALVLNIVIQALYKTFEPVLFREFNNEGFEEVNLGFYKIYLFALIVAAFATACFSKEFFLIATSAEFIPAYKIVPFLLLSVIIAGVNTYLNILMIALNKQKIVSVLAIISGISSVGLNFLLIPKFGIYGAVIASTTSFLIVNIVCHYIVKLKKHYLFSQFLLLILVVLVPSYFERVFAFGNIGMQIGLKFVVVIIFSGLALFCFNINISNLKKIFLRY